MESKPFVLSVKALVRDAEGRYLALRRAPGSNANAGKWDFPGGKLDEGEGLEAGLLREVFEETGLTVSLVRVVGAAQSDAPKRIVAYLLIEARVESGEVRLSDEHDEFAWTPREELPKVDMVAQFRAFATEFAVRAPGA
ncbi:MAG: NUDIX domain-containing protein [Candidatus Hydrogenedentes bacterium]|nr:NUDIX domain-containing protein [Candidatus Hydrogenedentota bacterium]